MPTTANENENLFCFDVVSFIVANRKVLNQGTELSPSTRLFKRAARQKGRRHQLMSIQIPPLLRTYHYTHAHKSYLLSLVTLFQLALLNLTHNDTRRAASTFAVRCAQILPGLMRWAVNYSLSKIPAAATVWFHTPTKPMLINGLSQMPNPPTETHRRCCHVSRLPTRSQKGGDCCAEPQ